MAAREDRVNRELRRLFLVLAGMLGAVIATGTYWLWRAPDLEARQGNPTQIVRQITSERGLVLTSDGTTVLARTRQRDIEGQRWFVRRYPHGPLAAHAVGYSTLERARTGLEASMNELLTGSDANLASLVDRARSRLAGRPQEGNHLVLTLDAAAQEQAASLLRGRCGATVALEPSTGRVLVMASAPAFDPNDVARDFSRITTARAACEPAAPLVNRATAGLFVPGSTFKVVTAAAALDSGRFRPGSTFIDDGYCIQYGRRVFNYADQDGPERFGRVTLSKAMERSINAVFCDIGKELDAETLIDYAKRFGFYSVPPLETPETERLASGLYEDGQLFDPQLPTGVDEGRLAFGQERLLATPLQMAMVAAAIANGGVLMKPYLVERTLKPDRSMLTETKPEKLSDAIGPATAAALARMMERVVASGTGRGARIPGLPVAGKTGTGETAVDGENDAWFIAFAPAEAAEVAVAVVISHEPETGGAAAAPIARTMIQTLLRRST
ncbi:MAG: penicillin-binding transpeptidase domain-containing protein [Actinomycetia bacterium]|nr:penicillin-binding transpeptidase domain-containing protein [Actinomycetes bacterium]